MRFHLPRLVTTIGSIAIAIPLAGCGAGSIPSPAIVTSPMPVAASEAPASAAAPVTPSLAVDGSATFAHPFALTLPTWVGATPETDTTDFVTWLSTTDQRAIRVLHPLAVYPPDGTTAQPVPDDYATYLASLVDHGMTLADRATTTIDGHPATLYTVTTDTSLDGVWGCQAPGLSAHDCFGAQPEWAVRLALVDVDGDPVLLWVRTPVDGDSSASYADFATMLASFRFR